MRMRILGDNLRKETAKDENTSLMISHCILAVILVLRFGAHANNVIHILGDIENIMEINDIQQKRKGKEFRLWLYVVHKSNWN